MFSDFFNSLSSLPFYRHISQSPLRRGFGYLAVLAGAATFVVTLFIAFRFIPEMDRHINWVKMKMPILTWTPQGLSSDSPNPTIIKHPELGHLATIDTSKKEVTPEEVGDAQLYLTSHKAYFRSRNNLQVYNLIPAATEKTKNEKVVINAQTVQGMQNIMRPMILLGAALVSFPLFFVWKLIIALAFSIFGLVLNLFRKTKLKYASILNVCIFALTASTLISLIQLWLLPFVRIPFGPIASFIVTSTYVFLGIKAIEQMNEELRVKS
jgi:hypothetical protein